MAISGSRRRNETQSLIAPTRILWHRSAREGSGSFQREIRPRELLSVALTVFVSIAGVVFLVGGFVAAAVMTDWRPFAVAGGIAAFFGLYGLLVR